MKLWCCLGWKLSDQCCEHSRPAEGELFITTEEGLSLECEVESLCDDAKEQEENDNHNDDEVQVIDLDDNEEDAHLHTADPIEESDFAKTGTEHSLDAEVPYDAEELSEVVVNDLAHALKAKGDYLESERMVSFPGLILLISRLFLHQKSKFLNFPTV